MTALSDRLDAMAVHASAPAGGVHGELHGNNRIVVYFSSGYYGSATESGLADRLEHLARLLWAERTRFYRQALEAEGDWSGDGTPQNDADNDFYDGRDQLTATGTSPDGRVTVSVRGMRTWDVSIAAGTLRSLDENEFSVAVAAAAARMINDQSRQMLQLKARVFGESR